VSIFAGIALRDGEEFYFDFFSLGVKS